MKDMMLFAAGGLGMVVALVHGYIGETKVVRPVQATSDVAKRVLQAIMFLSAVYWFVAGLVLATAPIYFEGGLKTAVAYIVASIFASGAVANFWATRGRHFGWMLLAAACSLAFIGA